MRRSGPEGSGGTSERAGAVDDDAVRHVAASVLRDADPDRAPVVRGEFHDVVLVPGVAVVKVAAAALDNGEDDVVVERAAQRAAGGSSGNARTRSRRAPRTG